MGGAARGPETPPFSQSLMFAIQRERSEKGSLLPAVLRLRPATRTRSRRRPESTAKSRPGATQHFQMVADFGLLIRRQRGINLRGRLRMIRDFLLMQSRDVLRCFVNRRLVAVLDGGVERRMQREHLFAHALR